MRQLKLKLSFHISLFFIFSQLSYHVFGQSKNRLCRELCNFRVCNNPIAYISSGDVISYSPICFYRNERIRRAYTNKSLPQFYSLQPPYKTKSGSLPKGTLRTRKSGISLRPGGNVNQIRIANGGCIRIPINSFIDKSGKFRKARKGDCVGIRVGIPKLEFLLTWSSRDDFDLFISEPGENEISFGRASKGQGILIRDDRRRGCGISRSKRVSRESVIYKPRAKLRRGVYGVTVEQNGNCGEGPTKWDLRVFRNGVLAVRYEGISDLKRPGIVRGSVFSFTI